jgi:predicted Zn-dependent protease
MAWVLLGRSLYKTKRFEEATQVLRQALETFPQVVDLVYWLALSLVQMDELKEATRLLHKGQLNHPSSPLPRLGLSRLALRDRDYGEVKRLVQEAEERSRGNLEIAVDLATILMEIPEEDARSHAKRLLERVVRSLSDDPVPMMFLAVLSEEQNATSSADLIRRAKASWPWAPEDFDKDLVYMRNRLAKKRLGEDPDDS